MHFLKIAFEALSVAAGACAVAIMLFVLYIFISASITGINPFL